MAALYAAETAEIPYTGWVPLHYTNETGEYGIPERFRRALKETSTSASSERTEKNIKDSDGILTLLLEEGHGEDDPEALGKSPGTLHGIEYAKKRGKSDEQLLFVNLAKENLGSERNKVIQWLIRENVQRCAIGGPRESESKGIQNKAFEFLKDVFEKYKREIE